MSHDVRGSIAIGDSVDFNTSRTAAPAYLAGRLFWDVDHQTLSCHMGQTDVTLQLGQETHIRVVNKTGSTLQNGSVCYVNGAQGNRPTVALADADIETADDTIGVITADILDNAEGYLTVFGIVHGVNTSTYTTGDALYVSTTAGELTKTAPASPKHRVRVGYALNSTNNGSVFVAVHSAGELPDIHDVSIATPLDGQILTYETSTGLWKNKTLAHASISGITTGDAGHTQFALLAGRAGGQTLNGGTAASENLTLNSTANATKGKILIDSWATFDEANQRVGIGTTTPVYPVVVTKVLSDPTANTPLMQLVSPSNTLSADNANYISGSLSDIRLNQSGFNATNAIASVRGYTAGAYASGASGTVTGVAAFQTGGGNLGAGTLTNYYGIYSSAPSNSGGGTITNSYGLYVAPHAIGTNIYGVSSQLSAATGRWNIYTGTAQSYFGGKVGIGVTAPTTELDVVGAAKISGDLTVDTDTLYVDSTNARIGVGTTSPQNRISVRGVPNNEYAMSLGVDYQGRGFEVVTQDYVAGTTGSALSFTMGAGTGDTRANISAQTAGKSAIGNLALQPTGGNVGIGTTAPGAKLHIAGDMSSTAWTTSGIALRVASATYTDTTSTGTIGSVATTLLAGGTIAASNPVTYTIGAGIRVSPPAPGTNVTITRPTSIYCVSGALSFTGDYSSPYLAGGAQLYLVGSTYTDTTSSGTAALATQCDVRRATFAATNATTYTTAATFYISNAPAAGTNVTFTNAYSMYVAAGNVRINDLTIFGPTGDWGYGARIQVLGSGTGSFRGLAFASISTNNANKGAMAIIGPRKVTTNQPFCCYGNWDNGVDRIAYIGGGAWQMPDATNVSIYCAGVYDETNGVTGNLRASFSGLTNKFTLSNGMDAVVGTNVFVTDTTNSRVGIGTATPSETLHVVGTGRVGGATDYTKFESDGTIVCNGAATVWNDIFMGGLSLRAGANAPTFAVFQGNIYANRFDDGAIAMEAFGSFEMQHDYKEGTALSVHIHWSPSTTNTGNIRWGFEYSVASANGTFSAATTIYVTQAGSGTAKSHQLIAFADISGTGRQIGDIIVFRVFRDSNNAADTFTGNAFLHQIGIHYECDTLGSRAITTK